VDLTHCAGCGAPTDGAYRCARCAAAEVAADNQADEAARKAALDRPAQSLGTVVASVLLFPLGPTIRYLASRKDAPPRRLLMPELELQRSEEPRSASEAANERDAV
jgi:hypothetical protein